MSYLLNGTTIKNPATAKKEPVEVSVDHLTISGKTKRDIAARKYRYTLTFNNIAKTDFDIINAIYNLKTVVLFQSSETNFPVSSHYVHVNMSAISYSTPGTDYRVTFTLTLIDVDAS